MYNMNDEFAGAFEQATFIRGRQHPEKSFVGGTPVWVLLGRQIR